MDKGGKGGGGLENWTIFMIVICVSSLIIKINVDLFLFNLTYKDIAKEEVLKEKTEKAKIFGWRHFLSEVAVWKI